MFTLNVYTLFCQGDFDRLNLRDMRGLLDDAAGESGTSGAALSQSRGGPCDTDPQIYIGPCNGEWLPGVVPPCGSAGRRHNALVWSAALPLGQVGQSHGSVDLPPSLVVSSPLAVILLLVTGNILKKNNCL